MKCLRNNCNKRKKGGRDRTQRSLPEMLGAKKATLSLVSLEGGSPAGR